MMSRIWNAGDPEPTDVSAVTTNTGSTFVRMNNGTWCNAKHATNPELPSNHRGVLWSALVHVSGPLTETHD